MVPWRGWQEWEALRVSLLDQPVSSASLAHGEQFLVRGRTPSALEATLSLQSALQQSSQPLPSSSSTDRVQRLCLASAVARAVNSATETLQTGKHASSVATLASKLDLPRSLVDIRHEAAHGELPPASTLRSAALQALQWLSQSYWHAQRKKLREIHQHVHSSLLHALAAADGSSFSSSDYDILTQLRDTTVPVNAPATIALLLLEGSDDPPLAPACAPSYCSVASLKQVVSRACNVWTGLTSEILHAACRALINRANESHRRRLCTVDVVAAEPGHTHRRDVLLCVTDTSLCLLRHRRSSDAASLLAALRSSGNDSIGLLKNIAADMEVTGMFSPQHDNCGAEDDGLERLKRRRSVITPYDESSDGDWEIDDCDMSEPLGTCAGCVESLPSGGEISTQSDKDELGGQMNREMLQPSTAGAIATDTALVQHLRERRKRRKMAANYVE